MFNRNNTNAVNHRSFRSRALAAATSGCLALSMCPALAMAAQPEQGGPQQGEPPAAMQQAPEGWQAGEAASFGEAPDGQPGQGQAPQGQAPDGQAPQGQMPQGQPASEQDPQGQMSDGQAPLGDMQKPAADSQMPENGMPGNRNDAVDQKVQQILSEQFGVKLSLDKIAKDGNDKPIDADKAAIELPEGEINVQQVIDSIRDLLRTYTVDELESADFTDASFTEKLTESVSKSNEERLARFASETKPDQANGKQAKTGEAKSASDEPPADETFVREVAQIEDEAPSTQQASESTLSKLICFIVGLFGQQA